MTAPVGPSVAGTAHGSRPVQRVRGLSHEDFVREYQIPRQPVVFSDATQDWAALSKWTPTFFQEHYGATEVMVEDEGPYRIGDVIAQMTDADPDRPAPYLHNLLLSRAFPDLTPDVLPLMRYVRPNWLQGRFLIPWLQTKMNDLTPVRLFIGGAGAKFPVLHFDLYYTHAFLSQIYGRKEYYLYPPEQTPFMYAEGGSMSHVNDVEAPDPGRFPLFQQAVPTRLVLEPGETLFVPAGWWHTARMLESSITISMNTVEPSNWADFSQGFTQMIPRVLRPPYHLYMGALGAYKAQFQKA